MAKNQESKKETAPIIRKLKETYLFKKEGIGIGMWVRIDYAHNNISLVDPVGNGKFRKAEYCFANRGVEYMNGWIEILQVMQEAIKDAKKRYETDLTERRKKLSML